ncbi:MAG: Protein-N(5)-glutamine methyltransferase PrmC, partial [Polaromonas sp.]|nr:Protein-N(5)-glutamine methyltransferase PrmC [Polaromonas sp.]
MAPSLPDTLTLLGRWLQGVGYQYTTITPASHARVNARSAAAPARDLRGVFGWSRPFAARLLPAHVLGWLREGGLLEESAGLEGRFRSQVRFSSLGGQLYAHSAYPTAAADAVFFGPDTYRFAACIEAELARQPLAGGARILDIGCGGGPGGMAAA